MTSLRLPDRPTRAARRTLELTGAAKLHSLSRVYTAEAVASTVLDLIGWRADEDLVGKRLLEPAAGDGVFLRLAAERLIVSARQRQRHLDPLTLQDAICAFEIWPKAVSSAIEHVRIALVAQGVEDGLAGHLATAWIHEGDFIRAPINGKFTHIAGNPPYIRWSKLPLRLQTAYQHDLPAGIARGDLCVPFLYRCASLLEYSARMGFVCSDRWLRSEYACSLRRMLHDLVRLEIHLEIHDFAAFDANVDAYAAISIFERLGGAPRKRLTCFAETHAFSELRSCAQELADGHKYKLVRRIDDPLETGAPIVVADPSLERAIRSIPTGMPLIETVGCRIRVGAALGHAPAFICPESDCDVESDRLLLYASSGDIQNDGVVCCNRFVVNPFQSDGSLVDLKQYPKLRRRLMKFKKVLSQRHCVKRQAEWFRTIDVINPKLASSPKILIAGIAKRPRLAIDLGRVQPGNSIYAIVSDEWPIAALYRLLRIGVLGIFVAAYSPRMSGGFLRFHKAVLKNIRIPRWASLTGSLRLALSSEAADDDVRRLVASHYNISHEVLTRYQ